MSRRLIGALLLALAGTGRATAQAPLLRFGSDAFTPATAVTFRNGVTTGINLVSQSCLTKYDVTLFFDAARLQLTSATGLPASNMPAPTMTTGTDSARLVATSGTFVCGASLATLHFTVNASATSGSLVSMRINETRDDENINTTNSSVAGYLDVCQGTQTWGDLDDNGFVTSRDALIALTAAVGLPTTGFDLSTADVDQDFSVTARDALFILSYGVGLDPGDSQAGQIITQNCAPLAPAPSDMLYWTINGLTRVDAGDTIPVELGVFGNSSSPARFSPDGGKIAYVCDDSFNDICTIDRDGGNQHELFAGSQTNANHPVWSPDGLKIAFIDINGATRSLIEMDSTGLNPFTVVTSSTIPLLELGGWSSAGLVYTPQVSGQRKLFAVNADGTSAHEVFASSSGTVPADPSWSPAADSVAFHNGLFASGSIFVVGASGGAAQRRGQLIGTANNPTWLPSGIAFASSAFSPGELMLRLPTGRYLRLTRTSLSGGTNEPSFR